MNEYSRYFYDISSREKLERRITSYWMEERKGKERKGIFRIQNRALRKREYFRRFRFRKVGRAHGLSGK